ncbi:Golgi SNAP receptor complex member 2-like [Acropora palmata]|uniref:Golgi SNAP receptor complex member 2-like n=1 Tax=Acropora palmata TaxID=6131 RepID=UPI003DA1C253
MDGLYQETNRLIVGVQGLLSKLSTTHPDSLHVVEQEIENSLEQASVNCDRLLILVNKEPPQKKQSARIKLDQLTYDLRHLNTGFQNYKHRKIMKEEEEKEREELLNRRFTPNNSGETSIMIDHALQHNTSLQNADRGIGDLLSSGSSILTSLRDQRLTLKGAHKRILDIASTLGLSNTVIRLIDKRATQDKWIVFGGMIVTCIIMFLVVKYLT